MMCSLGCYYFMTAIPLQKDAQKVIWFFFSKLACLQSEPAVPCARIMKLNRLSSLSLAGASQHVCISLCSFEQKYHILYRSWVKGAVVLVVLLGLTWILGVLYLNEESVVIAYFFTVLNSLQGLFIFVFHCLKNEKVSNYTANTSAFRGL